MDFSDIASRILYEDNHLLVFNKKPGEIVQGDKTGDKSLKDILSDYIKVKYNKPGNVYLGVAHRIDRPVSGAIIFAKTDKALTRINKLIHDRQIKKIYWAIVKTKPKNEHGTLRNHLWKNEEKNKSFVVDASRKGALMAELEYKVIGKSDNYFLLEVELHTGRHHQIRVQLAEMGCSIRGDLKYGYHRSNPDGSLSLHARKIEFIHPVKNEKMIIIAPTPSDNAWSFFEKKQ
ncbi:MAG TPA: RluA family pseudouridine synthase [Bacteroidales bacterium]|nr:RluA family pseudouridine synthase [Bacteroidales bacterium]HPS16225.1 RluA family pseudouridine synthase [Bacteroidales bacterium]